MYVSLYRKYRPQSFSEMVGQSAAVGVLRQSLADGRLGHAYLFSGPRGCGKTSAARLVAKALNCTGEREPGESCGSCPNCVSIAMGEHLDVIEIDGASNRGIGEIRDLKSHVNLRPLSSEYKVYIIDEVHMLTEAAFNALLKTLEEPPANVVFMLATTEPHKVPVTIRSRCQHIPFHRISITDMVSRLNYVTEEEGITADAEAVWEIARQADGALRDALSLFEQGVTLGKGSLTLESVNDLMGGSNRTELEKWVRAVRTEPDKAAADLAKMLARGISVERLTESLFSVFRDIWLYRLWGEKGVRAIENSESELAFLRDESANWDAAKSRDICHFLGRLLPRTRYGMRVEVYSGLVMLEILAIIEGKPRPTAVQTAAQQPQEQRQSTAPQKPQAPQVQRQAPPAAEIESELPAWDDDFSDLAAEFQSGSQRQAAEPPNARKNAAKTEKAEINFTESLGDTNFAKLLAAIGSKALVFGAALLSAEISEEDGAVKVEFGETLSPAESFLSAPQNNRVLLDAIYNAWGAGTPPKKSAAAKQTAAAGPPQVKKTAEGAARGEGKEGAGKAGKREPADGADKNMMLKLMGAELLYSRNLTDDEDTDEE